MLPILALIALTATSPKVTSDLLQQPSAQQTEVASDITVVYVGCQIQATVLSDCRVVNPDPVEPGAAAMALKLAAGMSVSQDLADRLGGHIVVKLNVKQ